MSTHPDKNALPVEPFMAQFPHAEEYDYPDAERPDYWELGPVQQPAGATPGA